MPIVGQMLTRLGGRALTGIYASLYAVMIACLALAPSYPLFVLATALFGACKGGLDVSFNAQLLESSQPMAARSCLRFRPPGALAD